MNLLSETEGELAVKTARSFVENAVIGENTDNEINLPEIFTEKRGVFVTLTEKGNLRGCIGYPYPVMPLSDAIKEAAVHAAVHDPRFEPVSGEELRDIIVEVTILTAPAVLEGDFLERPSKIKIGKHGLIAQKDSHSGLLLPQVATEYNWSAEEFLSQTCIKAGLQPNAWKDSECTILTFEGQIFTEK
ncbi:MAG: TIGR00296 family protein [Methanocorpusculum sp.]|nr:TIGR00296 family protein [Methanocorpusculum sp.]